ncbi:MAG TPA: hypothetical protein DEA08_32620 [Planctomycetes bacterium]|nr:hypothetical protein [Planctomycetota bacterium]
MLVDPVLDSSDRPGDPSRFYRLNEEVALELARLSREGHLARLQELLAAGGLELWVSSTVRREGLEELVGVLRPQSVNASPSPRATGLPPAQAPGEPGCGCDAAGESAPPPASEGGWDHESVLATRSRFEVLYPDGEAREVYMPDHICPLCLNEEGNVLESCARVCASCGFRW